MKSEYICTFKNQKFDIVLATLYSVDYYENETRTKWIFNDAITRKRTKLDDKFSEVDAFVKQKKKKKETRDYRSDYFKFMNIIPSKIPIAIRTKEADQTIPHESSCGRKKVHIATMHKRVKIRWKSYVLGF